MRGIHTIDHTPFWCTAHSEVMIAQDFVVVARGTGEVERCERGVRGVIEVRDPKVASRVPPM